MIIIERNGKRTVITGWRAWLIGAAVFLCMSLLFALIAFVVLGVTITLGAVLLIVVPVAIGVALLASVFRRSDRV
jgi:Na+/melibiose symporter-like transporter